MGKKKGGETFMEISQWKANLESARESKDSFFAQQWQSPIPPQDKPRLKVWHTIPLTRATDSSLSFMSIRESRQ